MVGCAVKLGDGPFEPLILLAIVGSVPKNTFSNSNSELQLLTPKIPIDGEEKNMILFATETAVNETDIS